MIIPQFYTHWKNDYLPNSWLTQNREVIYRIKRYIWDLCDLQPYLQNSFFDSKLKLAGIHVAVDIIRMDNLINLVKMPFSTSVIFSKLDLWFVYLFYDVLFVSVKFPFHDHIISETEKWPFVCMFAANYEMAHNNRSYGIGKYKTGQWVGSTCWTNKFIGDSGGS